MKPLFEYEYSPIKENRISKTILLIILIFVISVLLGVGVAGNIKDGFMYIVISIIFLFTFLSPYFVTKKIKIYEEHLEIEFFGISKKKPWAQFNRLEKNQKGFVLFEYEKKTKIDYYRSEFIAHGGYLRNGSPCDIADEDITHIYAFLKGKIEKK